MRPPCRSEIAEAWASSNRLPAACNAQASQASTLRADSGGRIWYRSENPLDPGAYTKEPRVRIPTAAAVAARSAPLRVLKLRVCAPGGPCAGTETIWIAHLHGGREKDRFPRMPPATSDPPARRLRSCSLSVRLNARRWTFSQAPGLTELDSTSGATENPFHIWNSRARRTRGAGIQSMCAEYQKPKSRAFGSTASSRATSRARSRFGLIATKPTTGAVCFPLSFCDGKLRWGNA